MHNIIKRLRETGAIYVRKGQGRRPLLDARGLWALRRHCITHRHDSVIDITKWAQEYFQKPLSVNTTWRAICRCQLNLYHAKKKAVTFGLKMRETVQRVISVQFKSQHLWWHGVHKFIRYFVHTIVQFLSLNIHGIYVLLWIKYWLMWFEILLVLILLKKKKTYQHFQNSGCIYI